MVAISIRPIASHFPRSEPSPFDAGCTGSNYRHMSTSRQLLTCLCYCTCYCDQAARMLTFIGMMHTSCATHCRQSAQVSAFRPLLADEIRGSGACPARLRVAHAMQFRFRLNMPPPKRSLVRGCAQIPYPMVPVVSPTAGSLSRHQASKMLPFSSPLLIMNLSYSAAPPPLAMQVR
jgi:hypothetical protein